VVFPRFTFLAGKWLAIDESDERLDCVIPVSKDENMNKFKFRVIHNAKENIAGDVTIVKNIF
jgi:hypothetical protein